MRGSVSYTVGAEGSSGHWLVSLSQPGAHCAPLPTFCSKGCDTVVSRCLCCALVFFSFAKVCTASIYFIVHVFFPEMSLPETKHTRKYGGNAPELFC